MTAGIINVIKPTGMTSHDVVDLIRRKFKIKQVGHCGTLDPAATGVLPIFIGWATKFIRFIEDESKTYQAEMILGYSTDSGDYTGKTLEIDFGRLPDESAVRRILPQFIGTMQQVPPMFSAVRIAGKKLYEYARAGQTIERDARPVIINQLAILSCSGNNITIEIDCSKGTYIRTLCEDIGLALGCPATMGFLRRTRAGVFHIEDAYCLKQIDIYSQSLLQQVDILWPDWQSFFISERQYQVLLNGHWFSCPFEWNIVDSKLLKLYGPIGSFAGLACIDRESNCIRPVRMVPITVNREM